MGSRCWQKMSLCPPPRSDGRQKEEEAPEGIHRGTLAQERDRPEGRSFRLEGRQTCARTGGGGQGHGVWGQGQDGWVSGLVAKVQGRAAGVKGRQLTSERKAPRQPREAAGKMHKQGFKAGMCSSSVLKTTPDAVNNAGGAGKHDRKPPRQRSRREWPRAGLAGSGRQASEALWGSWFGCPARWSRSLTWESLSM